MIFKQKPFPFSIIILAILIILHSAGSYFSWYWTYPWFDVFVHVFSGMWIALLILWLANCFGQTNSLKEYRAKIFLVAFVSAILFGVVWELIENIYRLTSIEANIYGLDTALDILNDGLGGILAYAYFIKRKKKIDTTAEILHPIYGQLGIVKN